MKRSLGAGLVVALAVPLFGLVGLSPAEAAAGLTVPAAPSGDVVVTAQADAATYPFVQVKLGRGTIAPPYATADVIDPAPVANPGTPVNITVPSWGIGSGAAVSFVLLGCTSSDPLTCTTLLDTQTRAITQTVLATAQINAPDGVLFVPEEQLTVTTANGGGGHMEFWFTPRRISLPNAGTTTIDGFPGPYGRIFSSQARRCSLLSSASAYCELVAARAFDYLISVGIQTQPTALVTHVSATPIAARVVEFGVILSPAIFRLPWELTWELRDSQGQTIAGPTPLAAADLNRLKIDPFELTGGNLALGEYVVVVHATTRKGALARSGQVSFPLSVLDKPPLVMPSNLTASRLIRPTDVPAHFAFDTPGNHYGVGELTLTDSSGDVVLHRSVTHPCWPNCSGTAHWQVDVERYRDVGDWLIPGRYLVRMSGPGEGGWVSYDLGTVDMQEAPLVRRSFERSARIARVKSLGQVGRCSSVRSPGSHGWASSVELSSGSKCSTRKGRRDRVGQVFDLPLPDIANLANVNLVTVQMFGSPPAGGGFLRYGCEVPGATDAKRVGAWVELRKPKWRTVCNMYPSNMSSLRGTIVRSRLTVRRGDSFDLRKIRVVLTTHEWRTPGV